MTYYDNDLKIWSGPRYSPLYNPNVTVGQVLLSSLERDPNKIGQINANNGAQYTNGEIRLKAIRAAQNLTKLGYNDKSAFVFFVKNSHNLAPLVIASFTISAVVCPIDPNYKKGELEYFVNILNPTLVFCDADNVNTVREVVQNLKLNVSIYVLGETAMEDVKRAEDLFEPTGIEEKFKPPQIVDGTKQVAAIMCSSGSTGPCKGIRLSHAIMIGPKCFLHINADDVVLSNASIFWVSGMTTLIEGTRIGALRIITTDSFRPDLMLQLIEKYKVTAMMTPPMAIAAVVDHSDIEWRDLSSVRYLLVGGGPLHESITQRMDARLPNGKMCFTYGFTEMFTGIVNNFTGTRYRSIGQPLPNIKIKIIDKLGQCLGVGERGEVVVKSCYPSLGYYKNEEASKVLDSGDGFIRSGDIGYFDEDGFLYLVDRIKDVIKFKNNLVFPTEIETIVSQLEGVQSVCIFGIPDAACGDLPAAAIVKKSDREQQLIESNVHQLVKDKVSDAKQLRGGIYFLDEMPLTGSGKMSRRLVKNIILNQLSK